MNFIVRSYKLELLDQPDIPSDDIRQNLKELSFINKKLGGHSCTLDGFHKLGKKEKNLHVCEIGCGGGDNLKAIENSMKSDNKNIRFTGIDINPDCIRVAKNISWHANTEFIASDYKNIQFQTSPDIIFCSLFCHHFNEAELIQMFRWMKENSRYGFFINDLHRHAFAYHSIRLLTSLFSKSYLVKHDAPLSVLRGFKKKELQVLLKEAGIFKYTIHWKWAFRWLVIVNS
ncbi:MAG TPA: methyltransferase domain-containing protein [Puia sp.]|jgi:ubiquinone/menaquinone biosynthesis C-methylase UbiE|nr:methyltransferase domain-containing protein [Puia sp.]